MTDAKMIWRKAQVVHDSLHMPHDGYLKLYQLSKPVITGYDVILVDEAQDQTPGEPKPIVSPEWAGLNLGPHTGQS